MNIETYARKSFPVGAVQATEENLQEIAEWCGGEVQKQETKIKNAIKIEEFVRVPVKNPLNEKQTRAYIGDWVLVVDDSYKVYTDRAFKKSFEKVRVITNAESKATLEADIAAEKKPIATTSAAEREHLESNGLTLPVWGGVTYTDADAKDQTVDYDFPKDKPNG